MIFALLKFLVYPFWMEVYIYAKGGPVWGKEIIIPGFNVKDEQVSQFSWLYRKIFVKEVYGMIILILYKTNNKNATSHVMKFLRMRGPHPELHVSIVIVYKYIIIVFLECNKDHDLITGE